jgi:Uma2 family endonuclease
MAIQIERRLFTVAEYEQMIRDGILKEGERIELIEGEIAKMSPINHLHAACVASLEFLFRESLGRRAYVWSQNPIWIDNRNRPQPDVTLLKWRDDLYRRKRPAPEDVLLVVEVSDSSLKLDREGKMLLYARAGIAEYWIANLQERIIEIHQQPTANGYQSIRKAPAGETIALPQGLGGALAVSDIYESE